MGQCMVREVGGLLVDDLSGSVDDLQTVVLHGIWGVCMGSCSAGLC